MRKKSKAGSRQNEEDTIEKTTFAKCVCNNGGLAFDLCWLSLIYAEKRDRGRPGREACSLK